MDFDLKGERMKRIVKSFSELPQHELEKVKDVLLHPQISLRGNMRKINKDNYEEIVSRVAELEYALDRAEDADDVDELPVEVRQQRSERLAKMNAELNVLSEALAEYELNR